MKKVVTLLLAMLLICSMLPLTAMAEGEEIQVKLFGQGSSSNVQKLTAGDIVFFTYSDALEYVKWTDKENAPTDKFVKLEVSEDGATLNVTLKNFEILNTQTAYTKPVLHFIAGDYAVNITLIGSNKLSAANSACIKAENSKSLTITGDGELILKNTSSAAACLWVINSDLTIKNTTMDITMAQGNTSLHHAILSGAGNVTIEGTKLTTTTDGGACVYFGTTDAKDGRSTPDTNPDRKLVIKDSEITATGVNKGKLFVTASPATISGSTLKLTGKQANLFTTAPVFEGEYTAIAGLAKNANDFSKLKAYQESKLSSYTFIYIVPGIQDLIPTEPEPEVTEPEATEPTPIVPDATTPDATEPDATTPSATTPSATTPAESAPTESAPAESTPSATTPSTPAPTDTAGNADAGKSGNGYVTVLIVLGVLIVLAVGAFGTFIFLQQKKLKEL